MPVNRRQIPWMIFSCKGPGTGIPLPAILASALISISILIGCDTNAKNAAIKNDIVTAVENNPGHEIKINTSAANAARLKKIVINEPYFLTRTGKVPTLTQQERTALQVEKVLDIPGLGDAPGNGFQLLDTIFTHPNTTVLLLAHSTENESRAWLVQYNPQHEITFSVLVYYADLVEYFFTITSITREDTITIVKKNDLEDDKSIVTTVFNFTEDLRFIEKK